jgi:hypothetical protein
MTLTHHDRSGGVPLDRALRVPIALASLAAAGIHFAVIQEHLVEYPLFGYLFLGLAWVQVLWPLAFLARPSRLLGWIGIVVNLGAVGVWAWSRAFGLPIGAEPWQPEPVGALDLAASSLEVGLAVLTAAVLASRAGGGSRPRLPTGTARLVVVLASAIIIVLASVAFLVPVPPDMG